MTGGTGFIGRSVVAALSNYDIELHLVVRSKRRTVLHEDASRKFIVTKDVFSESPSWWRKQLKGIDTVIHLAWYAEPGHYLTSPKNLHCAEGTLRLAREASAAGIRRFVGIGTCLEYKKSPSRITTRSATHPESPYAAAKLASFTALTAHFAHARVEFAWCRPFYLYGKDEDSRRLVPSLKTRISQGLPFTVLNGTQIRDYMDVEDAGRLIAKAAMGSICGPVNICSGRGISIRRLALAVAAEHGARHLVRFSTSKSRATDRMVGAPSEIQ